MGNRENAEIIGKILVEQGLVSPEDLDTALDRLGAHDRFICAVLAESGVINEREVLSLIASRFEIPYVTLKEKDIPAAVLKKIPLRFVNHYKIMPIKLEGNVLTIAVADPLEVHIRDDIHSMLGLETKFALASESDIEDTMRKYYGVGADTLDGMARTEDLHHEPQVSKESVQDITTPEDEKSIISLVNQILNEAVKDRATDIHLEPFEDKIRVRFRVDGILYNVSLPETISYFYPSVVSRIKIMANLNIIDRRIPQDGRIKIKVGDVTLDLRVSIVPTGFGEAVQIRILSPYFFLELENLGLRDEDIALFEQTIRKPHGIVLVTGPTGSGKSTTLYACLSRINSPAVKIVTIEDPVEYQLKGVIQLQVWPHVGLGFTEGLRSMLRHDPDIMMVGEIRDHEAAEIAIRASLTGHLVFSTLHTNDAVGSIVRLMDMGIEPFLLASSLECLVAQRLIRLICPKCKEKIKPTKQVLDKIKDFNFKKIDFYEGRGCSECRFTGYKGRTAIYEIIQITDVMRGLITKRASGQAMKQEAISSGMHTLRQDGFRRVEMGLTTIQEVLRVTQEEESA